jgi:hypothetical protein
VQFAETAEESKQRKLLGHFPGGQDALHLMAASMQGFDPSVSPLCHSS